ncbi:hypothetical protein GGR54DRAFT_171979 [Hypoxylon sp. NC1633]|nr:hypothetical protein GGR54DRAFT_171979 [Hypoxylon sp. NC1633]
MFACNACLRTALVGLIGHAFRMKTTSATSRLAIASNQSCRQRRYATAAALVETAEQYATREDKMPSQRISSREWAAKKELQYLTDPLHIATHVQKLLRKGDFEKAALITRRASKDLKVAVSWNHLIDHQLQHGKLHAGIKLFNEMKKRAILPNSQTYTIIFRGCAVSPHPKLAVSEAIRIYNAMLANSRIKPNTIHMNAVLQVCAKARDLDSAFAIAKSATDGLRAPDSYTYTTIFNAIRSTVSQRQNGPAQEVDIAEQEKATQNAVKQAKSIWEEVMSKWRAGSMVIDEELLCSMGRILLLGTYHDVNSIQALVEETMMIPREVETALRGSSSKGPNLDGAYTDVKSVTLSAGSEETSAPRSTAMSHALPGNNSLSMILSVLEKTGKTTNAPRYWDIFTEKYHVVPDANNWQLLFTVLRRGKNSAKTALYLRVMPAEAMVPKTFRTAMSTCIRDINNAYSFSNATEVLQIMMAKLRNPDLMTLRLYLRVAYSNKHYILKIHGEKIGTAMKAFGQRLADALDNLWEPYNVMIKQCKNDGPESETKRELVALIRKMIAAYDRIISNHWVSPEAEEKYKPRRNDMNRVVVQHFEEMSKYDPNFKPDDLEEEDDSPDFKPRPRQKRGRAVKEERAATQSQTW